MIYSIIPRQEATLILCITILGTELAVDFTAPALLALLSLCLPMPAFCQMCAACLLHETAHIAAMLLCGRKPALLRISAAGMRLTLGADALCPLPQLTAILLSGAAANFAAAAALSAAGLPDAAAANLSLGLFNLLPYRSTDGGTWLAALLEPRYIAHAPGRLRTILRICCIFTTLLLSAALLAAHSRNLSIWSMVIFMTAAEFFGES